MDKKLRALDRSVVPVITIHEVVSMPSGFNPSRFIPSYFISSGLLTSEVLRITRSRATMLGDAAAINNGGRAVLLVVAEDRSLATAINSGSSPPLIVSSTVRVFATSAGGITDSTSFAYAAAVAAAYGCHTLFLCESA
jgi:hypothetical protein